MKRYNHRQRNTLGLAVACICLLGGMAAFAQEDHTVSVPGPPEGPVSLTLNETGTFTSTGAACSLGHTVVYVFIWGDGTYGESLLSTPADSHSWSGAGSYAVAVVAVCSEDQAIMSTSEPLMVHVDHTMSAPGLPTGPVTLALDESGTYTGAAASCSLGHDVQYLFIWGDGTYSESFLSTPEESNSWSIGGSYGVSLVAVCTQDQSVMNMSEPLLVHVNHSLTTPGTPAGPVTLAVDEAGAYTSTGATCSLGHPVHYAYQWGDGTVSASWLDTPEDSKSWSLAGSYGVTLVAVCSQDQSVVSLSEPLLVHVDHTMSVPGMPAGPAVLDVDEAGTYTCTGATCSMGHPVKYIFQWGDGTMSESWLNEPTDTKVWNPGGTFGVTMVAVCSEDNSVMSVSDMLLVRVGHTVTAPGTPAGPNSLEVAESGTYASSGATCSLGHAINYVFVWGDGTYSDTWLTDPTDSKSWTPGGSYGVTVVAACSQDYGLMSVSEPLIVHVGHFVTSPGPLTGPTTLNPGDLGIYAGVESTCSLGHPVEYAFQWGDGTVSDTWLTNPEDAKSWEANGIYGVTLIAVCTEDRTVVSASDPLIVNVGHAISVPGTPEGPLKLDVNESGTFTSAGAVCSLGHPLKYKFYWGDGAHTSTWLDEPSESKSWDTRGGYNVTLLAACSIDYAINSVSEPLVVIVGNEYNADQNDDGLISLSEMLRVIQFFNSDGFHCEADTEDGYAPGPGDTTCASHASDYNTQDWHINLSELLRLIQFFNSSGYHACPGEGTEDGFCPGQT